MLYTPACSRLLLVYLFTCLLVYLSTCQLSVRDNSDEGWNEYQCVRLESETHLYACVCGSCMLSEFASHAFEAERIVA